MRADDVSIPCCLCERPFDRRQLTKHHCLPKSRGGTQDHVELLCSMCHSMVHATFTNKTLAVVYATIEELRTAPELNAYLRWVRRQPSTRRTQNKQRKHKI
jgi:hypothetical protein